MQEVGNTDTILQLERVASAVSTALHAIKRSADLEAAQALRQIAIEAGMLNLLLEADDTIGAVPLSPYASPVPPGFQTILGFYDLENPEYILAIRDPATAWLKDDAWLQKQAERRKIKVETVPACSYLKARGVTESVAYPIALLRERFY